MRDVFRHYQDRTEGRPDTFIRNEYRAHLLDQSRKVIAEYVHAPVDAIVLTTNTSTAIDTILRNLVYKPGDVIVTFSTVYGAFRNLLLYLAEISPVESWTVDYVQPIADERLCELFEKTLKDISVAGKTARVALFDTVTSEPGVRAPFERLTEICRSHGVLSCIDGAHGTLQYAYISHSVPTDTYSRRGRSRFGS